MMKTATLVVLALLAAFATELQAELPEYLAQEFKKTRWIAYSPTGPSSSPSDLTEMQRDLETLQKSGFGGIVTYGCDGLKKEIPKLARKAGIEHVILGIYDLKSEEELQNAKALVPWVDGYCVGNEGIGMERRYTIQQLRARMDELRRWSGKPVATSEQIEDYFSMPELLTLGDWLFPNVHPWWNGKATEPEASRWTKEQVDKLRQKAPTVTIVCKEVGMPTGSLDDGLMPPTEETQADYYLALRALDVPFIYFEAFDQVWKKHHPTEPFWGIFRSDRTPKRIVKLLASPAPGIRFTDLRDKGKLKVRREPDGGFFEVRGTSSGLADGQRVLLLYVNTGDFAAAGWFLQLAPNGMIDIQSDGVWTARGQIGNRDYPPRPDQKIGLKIVAVPKSEADKLFEQYTRNPNLRNRGVYSQDLPKVDPQWQGAVKDLELEIQTAAKK